MGGAQGDRLRWSIGVLVAGLGLVAAALLICRPIAGAAPQPAGESCGPADATTLARDGSMRLYEVGPRESAVVYVCAGGSGRHVRLGPISDETVTGRVLRPFALTSPWAGAVEVQLRGMDTTRTYVAAANPFSRGHRHCLVGGASTFGVYPRIKRLLLTKSGSLIWTAVQRVAPRGPQIGLCDASGPHVLAAGTAVDLSSVELRGSTLSWVEAGQQRSVRLP